jgi:hypothetical protein
MARNFNTLPGYRRVGVVKLSMMKAQISIRAGYRSDRLRVPDYQLVSTRCYHLNRQVKSGQ